MCIKHPEESCYSKVFILLSFTSCLVIFTVLENVCWFGVFYINFFYVKKKTKNLEHIIWHVNSPCLKSVQFTLH